MESLGTLDVNPNERTVGSLDVSSTTARTNSGVPSRARSATRGCVTERWLLWDVGACGLWMPIR